MSFFVCIVFVMLREDSVAPLDVYQQALSCVASDTATAAFLGCAAGNDSGTVLEVADSVYTLDRFPFNSSEDTESVSIYRADLLRPLRAASLPHLTRLSPRRDPCGEVFFSFLEGSLLLAEVFRFRGDFHSYEEYCLTMDSLKFLFSVTPSGILRVHGHRRLLR